MDNKELEVQKLSIGVLKTQNQALVSRLNLLKSKLKAAETDAEGRLPQQINCSLAVEMFSNRMSQLYQSILKSKDFISLSAQDPVRQHVEVYVQSVESISRKLKESLANGTKPEITEEIKSSSTKAMTVFQELVRERIKFNEILAGKDPPQDNLLKERCEILEKEKIGLLTENEGLKQQLADLKLQSGQVLHSLNEVHNLKSKLENYTQRFERLCRYQTSTVEELLQESDSSSNYNCICGGRLVQLCVEFIQSKQLELKDYKPAAAEAAQDHDHSNGTQKERLLENIVQELERKNQDLLMEVDKIKLDKAYLDGKFLKSGIMEDLTKQLFDVINYSMHLKQNLDTAQKNLDMIQKKRTQELKELYDRTNEEKQKLYSQVSSLQKDLNSYKERNSELSRAQEILRNTESSKELQNSSFDAQRIIELAARVVSLEESLAKVTETSRSDHNRAYKFERELHGIKETFYKQLLDQYAQCENMAYRHSRYEKTFKKFYELNAEQQLNLKDDLDELVKYVKTREDKIARIEKEWKKVSASLNEEKKQNETFLKEMTNTTKEYEKIYKEIQQLRVENAELNSNFNKVYKEKTADKQAYDTEVQKLREELKRFKEQVPVLKTTINELKTSIADHERAFIKFHDSYTTQKNILDQVMEEKNKLLLELENIKKDLQVNSTKTEHTEQLIKQKTKDLAEALNDLAKRKNFQDSIKKNSKMESDPSLMKIDFEEVLMLRAENEKLTRQVRCTVCNKRDRDSIITSCYHRFCSKCLTNCLENRDRKCPFCARKFGQHDVKKLYEE